MQPGLYDLLIVGGGINGAGIAADAAGRGLSVCLCEQGDLASGTSQASSKLVHGGLRYLEHYEFRLVREALAEREIMLARAPHIVWPLRFVLPEDGGMRSRLKLRAGLFLYDHLAARQRIPASRAVDLAIDPAGRALRSDIRRGFAYWDCWVDDARLVVLNARLAAAHGAAIRTRTRLIALERGDEAWTANVETAQGHDTIRAHVVVNAAGPWAESVSSLTGANAPVRLRLVKGSHIVVPRICDATDAFLFQNTDGRIVFALPFEASFTLIGTTDVPVTGSPADAACTPEEEDYLLAAVNRFLSEPITRGDIVWRFAGVRPLQSDESESDPSALSRDYDLVLSGHAHGNAMLTVIGGKVTTYRRLAESALDRLASLFPGLPGPWTQSQPLPGGDIPNGDMDLFLEGLARLYAWLPEEILAGIARRHGSLTPGIIADARRIEDMGRVLVADLTEREVRYMAANEWAATADDVLWRRTKAGLHLPSPADRSQTASAIQAMLDP